MADLVDYAYNGRARRDRIHKVYYTLVYCACKVYFYKFITKG